MKKSKIEPAEEATIDLTPMLDVVFIMLIFFIVTSTFIKEPGEDVALQAASQFDRVKNPGVLIAVTADNRVLIDKDEVDSFAVRFEVERLLAENPSGPIVVRVDRSAHMEIVERVIDQANLASGGKNKIFLATDEKTG